MEVISVLSCFIDIILLVIIIKNIKVLYNEFYEKIRKLELRMEVLENECSRFNK